MVTGVSGIFGWRRRSTLFLNFVPAAIQKIPMETPGPRVTLGQPLTRVLTYPPYKDSPSITRVGAPGPVFSYGGEGILQLEYISFILHLLGWP